MDALRTYLSPASKKARNDGNGSAPSDEDDMFEDSNLEQEQPLWAKRQEQLLMQMNEMITHIKNEMSQIKTEVSHIKLQAGIAQSTAEEAIARVGELEEQMQDVEDKMMTREDINKIISDEIAKQMNTSTSPPTRMTYANRTQPSQQHGDASTDDKFGRTIVVGGFPQDSEKRDVVTFINDQLITDVDGVDEVYSYSFGNVGFIRFNSVDEMWAYVKQVSNKPKPKINGKDVWISVSKSPEDRRKCKVLGKNKKVLIEVGLASSSDVRIDYKRGIMFVKKVRVAEWSESRGLVHNPDRLKEVGIDVPIEKLVNAVREELME